MLSSILTSGSSENPAIRRQLYQLTVFAAVLFAALLALLLASFAGMLPNWVFWAANCAVALAAWFVPKRSDVLRRRLNKL